MNRSISEYFLEFIYKYKFYLLLLILVASVASCISILVNYQVKEMIDTIAEKKVVDTGYLLLFFAIFKFSEHIMFFFWRCLDVVYGPKILKQTMVDMYSMSFCHSLHWFDSNLSGTVANKILGFQKGVSSVIRDSFFALNNTVTIIISIVFLWSVNIYTACILLTFVVVYIPSLYFLMQRQMLLQRKCVDCEQESVGVVNDSISNVFGIKTIGNIGVEMQTKIFPSVEKWSKAYKRMCEFDAYFVDNIDTILVTLMSVVQMYYLIYFFQRGMITSGDFAFVAMITLNIHYQMDRLMSAVLFSINPGIAQIKVSYEYVSQNIEVVDRPDAINLKNVKGNIVYKDVSFVYGKNDKKVLSTFNLNISEGERLGVVGLSGAGKSTMIKALLRYFDVSGGSLSIDEKDIRDVIHESLLASIAIIPQDITMFHRSIRDNLLLANNNATDEMIQDACRKANIHDDIMLMQKAYDTIVGERGVKLSGGQRQRIAIARAILKNAPILILDEATSSLDSATEGLIQGSINKLLDTSKSTVIAIAHRLSTLKHMDRIIVMEKGSIVEQGSHEYLLSKNGKYKLLWDMQII